MTYDYKRLDSLIKTEQDKILAECARDQYHEAIDGLMGKNTEEDMAEFQIDKPRTKEEIEKFAQKATEKRLNKYGALFFDEELERLMDKFNSNEIEKKEFLIRCEVLKGVTEALKDFKMK